MFKQVARIDITAAMGSVDSLVTKPDEPRYRHGYVAHGACYALLASDFVRRQN